MASSVQVVGQSRHVVSPVCESIAHLSYQLTNITVVAPQGVKQSQDSTATEGGILLRSCFAPRSDFLESVLKLLK